MFCIFRYLCVTVYIQLFSFRAASVRLINSVVSQSTQLNWRQKQLQENNSHSIFLTNLTETRDEKLHRLHITHNNVG